MRGKKKKEREREKKKKKKREREKKKKKRERKRKSHRRATSVFSLSPTLQVARLWLFLSILSQSTTTILSVYYKRVVADFTCVCVVCACCCFFVCECAQ